MNLLKTIYTTLLIEYINSFNQSELIDPFKRPYLHIYTH